MSESTRSPGVLAAIDRLGREETRLRKTCERLARVHGDPEIWRELSAAVDLVAEGYCNMMIETAREERARDLDQLKREIMGGEEPDPDESKRGQVQCGACGSWHPIDAPFCLRCGTDVDVEHPNRWQCRNCTRINGPGSITCGRSACASRRLDWQGTRPDPDLDTVVE